MSNQKLDTLNWFVKKLKETKGIYLWLASSGAIITGKPIDSAEYYRTIFRDPNTEVSRETENFLAWSEVQIRHGQNVNNFNVALVDLSMIVAWGAYDPTLLLLF